MIDAVARREAIRGGVSGHVLLKKNQTSSSSLPPGADGEAARSFLSTQKRI